MEKPASPLPCPLCGSAVVEIPNGFKHASSEHDDAIENCPLAGMSWSRSFYLPAWNRRVPHLTAINAELVEAGRAAETWLRAISTWLLETDNDMKLPSGVLDTDPLDLADDLAAILRAERNEP